MLMTPVADPSKLDPRFETVRTSPAHEPTRRMLEEAFREFPDPENNFVEQFQTTAFDARLFELYLFSYIRYSGFAVDRSQARPDFLITRSGLTVAVEATTVNPPTYGILARLGKRISDLSPAELKEYQSQELPIRFGSPLYTKLQKRYWELPHCQGRPLVLAIEAFHDDEALALTDRALSTYLYGLDQAGRWSPKGTLQIETNKVESHSVGEKTIPSNFFAQPNTEHISAVLFTNSGTSAKFTRMGYQQGIANDSIMIKRVGYAFNWEPDAMDATFFTYYLNDPPVVESWGQGIVVLHNPDCQHPVPHDFFPHAVNGYIRDGVYKADVPRWHVTSSKTIIMNIGEPIPEPFRSISPVAVGAIPKDEFRSQVPIHPLADLILEERGWYSDDTDAFLGVVFFDKGDHDWGYVILARDPNFEFRGIIWELSFPSREAALRKLQGQIVSLRRSPQRIFPQEEQQSLGEWCQVVEP